MRTRTSPRNQEILWRELGGGNAKSKPVKVPTRRTVEEIESLLAGVITDRHRRRELERELVVAKQRAEAARVLDAERGL